MITRRPGSKTASDWAASGSAGGTGVEAMSTRTSCSLIAGKKKSSVALCCTSSEALTCMRHRMRKMVPNCV